MLTGYHYGTYQGIMIPNATLTKTSATHFVDDVAAQYLHATDGFVVAKTTPTNSLNKNAVVYYYSAISE